MSPRDFILSLLAVTLGTLAALFIWTVIVKQQVESGLQSASQSPAGRLLSIFG